MYFYLAISSYSFAGQKMDLISVYIFPGSYNRSESGKCVQGTYQRMIIIILIMDYVCNPSKARNDVKT